jgi:hypothetical protein
MSGTPPAPDYVRSRVIPSATYVQISPFERVALRDQYNQELVEESLWQQRAPQDGYFNVAGLGRSVMPNLAEAKNYPLKAAQFPQGLTSEVQKGLWTAQVLAFWLTDGVAYKQYKGMEGLVSASGHDPGDPSAVLDANGYAKTDLRSLLNPKGQASAADFVTGPDSIFGPELESVVEEYAGTGKLFGKQVPSAAKPVLDRLLTQVSTPKIAAALSRARSGNPPAPKSGTALTPCSQLTASARAARKDCASGSKTFAEVSSDAKTTAAKRTKPNGSNNTLLYVGIAGLTLAVGASAYLVYKNKRT